MTSTNTEPVLDTGAGDGRPLRVCMIARSTWDADSRIQRQAHSLAEWGHHVTVLALPTPRGDLQLGDRLRVERVDPLLPVRPTRPEPLAVPTDEHVPVAGAGVASLPVDRTPLQRAVHALWATQREARRSIAFYERIMQLAPEVVHAHDADTLRVAHWAASRLGAPLVLDVHEYAASESGRSRRARRSLDRVQRRHLRSAAATMTVSPSIAAAMVDEYDADPQPVLLRNTPEVEDGRQVDLRAMAGILDDRPIVLYLGGLTRERGLVELVAAAAGLDVHFVALGNCAPDLAAELRAIAQGADASERLHLLPPVPPADVVPAARGADVGAMTIHASSRSHWFALPNKLFESLAAGLPVVVSDFPDMRAVVDEYGCGATCDPTDVADIRRSLAACLAPDEAMRAGVARASRELRWDVEREALREVYRRIASMAGP